MQKILFALLFISSIAVAQKYTYKYSIGTFEDATSFHINAAGFIFITDAGNNQILKIDSLGKSIKESGGYGWQEGQFDYPADIFATPLSVYVADKNNHRIERFDKDLNFVSSLTTRDNEDPNSRFGYPMGCVISNQGDMFILDSENKRIVKYDMFGNYIQNFGGYDYGRYALHAPTSISVDQRNNIYVLDDKRVLTFDLFGNGIGENISPEALSSLKIVYNYLTINSNNNIYLFDLNKGFGKAEKLNVDMGDSAGDIKASFMFNSKLYVLTSKKIVVFQKP